MLMPFRYLIKKPKQGEKMDNAQELKAHLQDSNKARMYEAKKKQDKHNLLVDKMYEKVEQQINKKATMKDKK